MYYVIAKKDGSYGTLIVKADTEEEVAERLILAENEYIAAGFTDNELGALQSGRFVVVSTYVK